MRPFLAFLLFGLAFLGSASASATCVTGLRFHLTVWKCQEVKAERPSLRWSSTSLFAITFYQEHCCSSKFRDGARNSCWREKGPLSPSVLQGRTTGLNYTALRLARLEGKVWKPVSGRFLPFSPPCAWAYASESLYYELLLSPGVYRLLAPYKHSPQTSVSLLSFTVDPLRP